MILREGRPPLAGEVEDLRALSFQASAFTGVKMAGIDRAYDW